MGHKKAAIAVFKAFQKRGNAVTAQNIDTLEYANKFYKFVYNELYVFLMTSGKMLWGFLYYLTDLGPVDAFMRLFKGNTDIKNLPGLAEMITRENPDAIVTTHFVLPSISEILKKKNDLSAKTFVVVTDYGPHAFWIAKDIDRYFIGADAMMPAMLKKGIPKEKITVTGIPTVEEFTREMNSAELRSKYGIQPDRKTIFTLSGGFGVGPTEEILKELCACKEKIQVIAVCGHNKQAYSNIEAMRDKLNYPVILFGFTDKVAELMAVSDLMVTKAGGISVTEALNMRLPMILFESIPGQETWNEKLLVEAGAARKAASIKEIPALANAILSSPVVYDSLRAGIEKIRRPRAADDIVDAVLRDIA